MPKMSCNTCSKSFSILRKERGCPGCGFSFCSSCLNHKVFVNKLNKAAKVCSRCSVQKGDTKPIVSPPDAFIKRSEASKTSTQREINETDQNIKLKKGLAPEDQLILDRLRKLQEKPMESVEDQITQRLKKLRGEDSLPRSTEEEIRERLARLTGETSRSSSNTLPTKDLRSDQEKSEDIVRQYLEEVEIDASNKGAFDERIKEIESRLRSLSGTKPVLTNEDKPDIEEEILKRIFELPPEEKHMDQETPDNLVRQYLQELKMNSENKDGLENKIKELESRLHTLSNAKPVLGNQGDSESESEEEVLRRIIEQANSEAVLADATLEMEVTPSGSKNDTSELPWCEICNEDAVLRCLGCRYLFCKNCFNEHKDDDGCNRYEPYKPEHLPA